MIHNIKLNAKLHYLINIKYIEQTVTQNVGVQREKMCYFIEIHIFPKQFYKIEITTV